MRRLRFKTYYFLDHPMSAHSTWYHFGVFGIVLLAIILGATYKWQNSSLRDFHFYMEAALAFFFICEFCVRMWCVAADAKYAGFRGRVRYLTRVVSIVDVIIILVTTAIVYLEKAYISEVTLDYLRFIQIMRLFHVDRQMTTWHLIKDMVLLSKWELMAAYYITFILCLLMANLVFVCENEGLVLHFNASDLNKSEQFPTLAHAWWFTIVTVPTIGYGDIVPSQWSSRIIVCFLGFLAYCTFVAASTQISVGLTLMMEENSKKECKNKLRHVSASVIQFWYRFHLASARERRMTEYFRRFCFKLYVIAKRMQRNHQMAAKLREKVERKKRIRNANSPSDNTGWKRQISVGVAQQMMQTLSIDMTRGTARIAPEKYTSSITDEDHRKDNDVAEKLSMYNRRGSNDTNLSSSFDLSDIETHIDTSNMYEDARSDTIDISEVEEWRLQKYRPLLRFFNFLLFREYAKKLRRLRKSDRLLEIDAEIREQENVRHQNLRQLELRVNAMLGKPGTSILNKNTGEKICMMRRLDLCEEKMNEMEHTMGRVNELVHDLSRILSDGTPPAPPTPTSPARRIRPHHRSSTRTVGFEDDGSEVDI